MTEEVLRLSGFNAVVLGANDPVAADVALALARAGADVAVTSSTGDAEEAFALRPLRRAIEAMERRGIADIADLSNGSSVQIAVRQIAKQLGSIDIVVIAAGDALDKPSERVTDAEWHRAISFNLGAYFYACRAAAKEFVDNEPGQDGVRGRIIALVPVLDADTASPVLLAARAGVDAMVSGLAREWVSAGIVVSAVEVGSEEQEGAVAERMFRALDAELPRAG